MTHRWSGAQPGGRREPGRGGLYVSLERESVLDQAVRHRIAQLARRVVDDGWMRIAAPRFEATASGPTPRSLYVFELERNLQAIDLGEGVLKPLLARLDFEVDVRHALAQLDFTDLTSAWRALRDDPSISRALGNAALMRTGADALLVDHTRSDYTCLLGAPEPRGRSAVLAGADNIPLPYLRPLYRLACEDLGGGALRCERRSL